MVIMRLATRCGAFLQRVYRNRTQSWKGERYREGYMESLPLPDSWADVVISNGCINLAPDKSLVLIPDPHQAYPGLPEHLL